MRYKGNTETEEIKNVHLYEWNGGDNQRWKLIKDTDGFYEMQCKGNGLFLDVHEGKDENGQNVVAYKRNGTNAQKWKIIPKTYLIEKDILPFVIQRVCAAGADEYLPDFR